MTKTPDQILDDAADAIDVHGWTTGAYGSPEKGFCAYGSIRYAAFGAQMGPTGEIDEGEAFSLFTTALTQAELFVAWSTANAALAAYLMEHCEVDEFVTPSVPWWNDHMAESQGEVTDTLRTVAKKIRDEVPSREDTQ